MNTHMKHIIEMKPPFFLAPRVYPVKLKKCTEMWTWEMGDNLGAYFHTAQEAVADMQRVRDRQSA